MTWELWGREAHEDRWQPLDIEKVEYEEAFIELIHLRGSRLGEFKIKEARP